MTRRRALSDHLWQRIRSAYYAFDFLRALPFGDRLGCAVHAWEMKHGFGDSPKGKQAWDDQYARGDWDYLGRLQESSRYSAIIGYITLLQREGALLDVGCGDGILYARIKHLGCAYTGVDISEVATSRLQARHQDASATFIAADGDQYIPTRLFDLIVFNESLYYLQEPLKALQRYAAALKPHGVLIVSTYMASRRATAILRDAKEAFVVVDETGTTQGSMSWLCTVLKPHSGQ
jgi:2-polyprenyl-3-methyl-5-hydroxy-6-metoxy-1,4-benzoquinol methylase